MDQSVASMSQEGSTELRPSTKKKKRKVENFASVSSSIMLKLPTKNLGALRDEFLKKAEGLNLTEFLEAVINNMELPDVSNLMLMISDLTDFFQLVDINGDGVMEWEEFVMFILDAVVPNKEGGLQEMFEPAGNILLQPPSSREIVHVVKMLPELGKVVVGIGSMLQFYEASEYAPALSVLVHKFRVTEEGESRNMPSFTIVDVTYIVSQEVVCVIKDNLSASFYKLRAPTNINSDTIIALGTHYFGQPYAKLVFRDLPNMEPRVFGIYNSSTIDSYKCRFSKYKKPEFTAPKPLSKHKDYVRDILIISTHQFKYICSAGLDKTVQFWDLEDLRYKYARTGPKSGIQCLAFDGSRLLLGGGFDYTIVGWDLYNTLDQPVMLLSGHRHPIYRIVPIGPNERCCSLDESGTMCWWDSSLTTPSDDNRLITTTEAEQDRIKDFDLYLNCGVNYNTQHGCIVVAAGRKQLTYRISDFSPNESAPLAILYSKTLLSLVTVHVTDIIFWSVVSAERHKTLNNIFGSESHTRVCSACLDDRGRKLYVGDSDGYIGVYNCLNGLKLKSIFVMPHAAIKEMIYTVEKYLIVVAGNSDLLVVDEYYVPPPPDLMQPGGRRKDDDKEPVTNAAEPVLRQVVAHESECRSVAFSAELGLIATVDVFGELCVWDYQLFNLKFIFKDCAEGSDVGEIRFLHPFPLLLITANSGELIVLNLAENPQKYGPGDRIYRVQQRLSRKRRYSADEEEDIMTTLNRMETQYSSMFAESSNHMGGSDGDESEDEGEPELTGARAKAYDRKRIGRYKRKRNREVTSISFCIQDIKLDGIMLSGSYIETIVPNINSENAPPQKTPGTPGVQVSIPPPHEPSPVFNQRKSGVLEEDRFAQEELLDRQAEEQQKSTDTAVSNGDVDADGSIVLSGKDEVTRVEVAAHVERRKRQLELERNRGAENVANLRITTQESMDVPVAEKRRGVENRTMRLVFGHNDGTLSVLDITDMLREIEATEIAESDNIARDPKYNPSRKIHKGPIRDGDEGAKTWTDEQVRARERLANADFVTVWRPHDAAISQLQVVGDYNYVVTSSEDASVYLWTMEASFRGTLTRGRDFDRVFRRTWDAPVDLAARDIRRAEEAEKLIRDHNLLHDGDLNSLPLNDCGELQDSSFIRLSRTPTARSGTISRPARSPLSVRSTEEAMEGSASLVSFDDNANTWQTIVGVKKRFTEKIAEMTVSGIPTEDELREVSHQAKDLSDAERLIMQLSGAMTYQPSKKEFSQLVVGDRTQALVEGIQNAGSDDGPKNNAKQSATSATVSTNQSTVTAIATEESTSNARYYETIRAADEILATKSAAKINKKMKRWEHEQEMADIDAKDPDNWDLKSYNRKREMYANWFTEMTKGGVINDKMNVIKAKLNMLTPTGNFQEYATALAEQKKLEREQTQKRYNDRALRRIAEMHSVHSQSSGIEDSNYFSGTKSIEYDDPSHRTAFGLKNEDEDNEDEEEADQFNSDVFVNSMPVRSGGRSCDNTVKKKSSVSGSSAARRESRTGSNSPGRKKSASVGRKTSMAGSRKLSTSSNRKQSDAGGRKQSISPSRRQSKFNRNPLDEYVNETNEERIKRVQQEEMRAAGYNKDLQGKKYSLAYVRKKSEQVIHAHVVKVERKVATLGRIGEEPTASAAVPPILSFSKTESSKNDKTAAAAPLDTDDSLQWTDQRKRTKARVSSAPEQDKAKSLHDNSIASGGLVKYSSMGHIGFNRPSSQPEDEQVTDVSCGRYSRNCGFVNPKDDKIGASLPRIRSGTMPAVLEKETWHLTAAVGVEIGSMIGTRATTPKTIDPVVLNNEIASSEREENFQRSILSSLMQPRASSPALSSDDGSMAWRPGSPSRSVSPLSRSPPREKPPAPSAVHSEIKVSVPFSADMAESDLNPSLASPGAMCETTSPFRVSSPAKFEGNDGASLPWGASSLPRNNSSFMQVLTPEEARCLTQDSMHKFESVVKPLTEKQYKKLVDASSEDFENSKDKKKKKKRRKLKRKPSDISVKADVAVRLVPIDIETIKSLKPKIDPEQVVRSPYGRSRNSIMMSPIPEERSMVDKGTRVAEAWMRKVQYALSDDRVQSPSRRMSMVTSALNDKNKKFSKLSSTVGVAPDAREADNDKRILSRLSFGTCKAEDLLKLRDAFVEVAREAAAREAKDTMDLTNIDTVDLPPALVEGKFKYEANMQVIIPDFLNCPYMQKKKPFRNQLKQYVDNLELRGKMKLTFDMKTILKQIFPLMPDSDRRDCVRYFVLKETSKVDREKKKAPLTEEELLRLREMFDYFDRDKGGSVDPKEIMDMLNMGKENKISVMDAEFTIAEKDVEATNVVSLINSVDQDDNAELDFEEFCELFRGAF